MLSRLVCDLVHGTQASKVKCCKVTYVYTQTSATGTVYMLDVVSAGHPDANTHDKCPDCNCSLHVHMSWHFHVLHIPKQAVTTVLLQHCCSVEQQLLLAGDIFHYFVVVGT